MSESSALRRVTIVHNVATDPESATLQTVRGFFEARGVCVQVVAVNGYERPASPPAGEEPDLALVIGGDGTVLRATRAFCETGAPIVGVNRGNLGFLARIDSDRASDYLERLVSGRYTLEERLMLRVQTPGTTGVSRALNDAMVKNVNPSQMGSFRLFINETPVATYDADGVIIATPTGSTAYTVSAGGPVISPEADVLAITPICPHSLSNRPIITPADKSIRIEAASANARMLIALDGMEGGFLRAGESIIVEKAAEPMRFVTFRPEEEDFYWLLKTKLHWARNPRWRPGDLEA